MSRWRTPKCDSASMTALWAAGMAPIVPASPIPFAPRGFRSVGVIKRKVLLTPTTVGSTTLIITERV